MNENMEQKTVVLTVFKTEGADLKQAYIETYDAIEKLVISILLVLNSDDGGDMTVGKDMIVLENFTNHIINTGQKNEILSISINTDGYGDTIEELRAVFRLLANTLAKEISTVGYVTVPCKKVKIPYTLVLAQKLTTDIYYYGVPAEYVLDHELYAHEIVFLEKYVNERSKGKVEIRGSWNCCQTTLYFNEVSTTEE